MATRKPFKHARCHGLFRMAAWRRLIEPSLVQEVIEWRVGHR
jgi:hypothetical protein